jgi:ribonuclease HII
LNVPFLIGTDEAGYGPNLGPLTVTGTLWQVDRAGVDLYEAINRIVTNQPIPNRSKANDRDEQKIFIADSKKVYKPAGTIRRLETSVLAMVYAVTQHVPQDWMELVDLVCPVHILKHLPEQVWLAGQTLELPVKANVDQIRTLGDQFRDGCTEANVELMELQCVPVFPPQFNSQVERLGNKATLLSTETLQIVRRLMHRSDDDLEIGCDKHGGRSHYAALIQEHLTEQLVMVGTESLEVSDYSFRETDRDVFIRFQAKGESFLPTALASMVSKYMREVFMEMFNDFWGNLIPDLKPTAGYYTDGRRFLQDIAQQCKELNTPMAKLRRIR